MTRKEIFIEVFKKGLENSSKLNEKPDPLIYNQTISIDYVLGDVKFNSIQLVMDKGKLVFGSDEKGEAAIIDEVEGRKYYLEAYFYNNEVSFRKKEEIIKEEHEELLKIYTEKFNLLNKIVVEKQLNLEKNFEILLEEYIKK